MAAEKILGDHLLCVEVGRLGPDADNRAKLN